MSANMRPDDKYRMFLQILMHAGIMSDYDFQQTAFNVFNYNNSTVFYKSALNKQLEPLGLMIQSAHCEFTGEKYWMLMSAVVDNVTRFQTEFTPAQLEFLRKNFDEIIGSMDGCISSTASLNLCTNLDHPLDKTSAQTFLNDCVNRMWLTAKDGHYYMGVRSIIELMPYFKATHEEGFNNCALCKAVVFHGRRCEGCQMVSHLYCLAKLAQVQKPLKCPSCNTLMSDDNLPEPLLQQEPVAPLAVRAEAEPGVSGVKRIKRSNRH